MTRRSFFTSPRLRGEVRIQTQFEFRVRGASANRLSTGANALSTRHCERSEAIQRLFAEGFRIASLRSQ
jgi:hypothetical protein